MVSPIYTRIEISYSIGVMATAITPFFVEF